MGDKMRLLFKQRFFSWLDSYDIYDEDGKTVFTVEGQLSIGHCLHVLNAHGEHVATLQQKILSLMPKFYVYENNEHVGTISREFTFFFPSYHIDYKGWSVEGDMMEWDYEIKDASGQIVASVSKELFKLTDTYVIDVADPEDALAALMLVLAIDAEKCSRK